MDGTLKDLQGPDLFFNLLKVVISAAPIPAFSGKVQILNSGDRHQNRAEYYLIATRTWATLSVPSISKEILE